MNLNLVITEDGSHTISIPELGEHYHSVHGAINESRHIFIEAGLKYVLAGKNTINILEIGFGTGLNALLTFQEISKTKVSCEYHTVEAFPLIKEIYMKLNYSKILNISNELFLSLHDSLWNKKISISPDFIFQKIYDSVLKISLPKNYFDLIFFDAFAPDVQPEMWTKEVFSSIYNSMKTGAVLVTYSTKGDVKRTLKDTGFLIKKLPGPKGKREILRATK
ncbi:MAG: tRNA (5-methylaminomethyl-2-thiouridine)(34)-methyltransferase MnmD [Bacteroidetes bacterium]|nr:tRNA (5-methylaminomethyl-2-thiouridine)(34)-methyltransferase MnmD [Bacteroidota bacterium]